MEKRGRGLKILGRKLSLKNGVREVIWNFIHPCRKALDLVISEKVANPAPTAWRTNHGYILDLIISLLETELQGLEVDYEDE